MNTLKYASIFSGAGGVDTGATDFGLDYVWGIERNKLKWQINQINFPGKCILADVRAVKPDTLKPVDVLWASPPCQHASNARRNPRLPEHRDRFIGDNVCRYLHALTPDWFFLENVPAYRKEPSFLRILKTLEDFEYRSKFTVLDFADYGIQMNRRRLILVANRTDTEIQWPLKIQAWTGWYDVLCRIWNELETVDDFPKWQRESIEGWAERRIHETERQWQERVKGYVVNSQSINKASSMKLTIRALSQPIFTLTCSHSKRPSYAQVGNQIRRLDQYGWARLMTLPPMFCLPTGYGQAIKCLGDMVPPMFVRDLFRANLNG